MKFRLYKEYGAQNSKPVFEAFETSLTALGHEVVLNDSYDVAVIWSVLWHGTMAKNKPVWDDCQAKGKPVIVLEVGGIKRGTTWKVAINGINREADFGDGELDSMRPSLLGLNMQPWQLSGGRDILICGQHDKSHQWRDMPSMATWVLNVMQEIRKHTARPIIFRPHPRCRLPGIEHEFINVKRQEPNKIVDSYDDFDFNLSNVFAVVSWTSNPGIHAVLQGVPAFVGPASLAYDVANHDFNTINLPQMPDRTQWLLEYAHTEWNINEIAQGIPLKRLLPKLKKMVDKTV